MRELDDTFYTTFRNHWLMSDLGLKLTAQDMIDECRLSKLFLFFSLSKVALRKPEEASSGTLMIWSLALPCSMPPSPAVPLEGELYRPPSLTYPGVLVSLCYWVFVMSSNASYFLFQNVINMLYSICQYINYFVMWQWGCSSQTIHQELERIF